jgi:hypothetical protein
MNSSSSAWHGGRALFWKQREDRRRFDAGFVGSLLCGLHVLDDDPPYLVCTAWRTDPRTSAPSACAEGGRGLERYFETWAQATSYWLTDFGFVEF